MAIPSGHEGDKALLKSPPIAVTEEKEFCVHFKYIQYGFGSGALSLEKRNSSKIPELLWEVCLIVRFRESSKPRNWVLE